MKRNRRHFETEARKRENDAGKHQGIAREGRGDRCQLAQARRAGYTIDEAQAKKKKCRRDPADQKILEPSFG